MSYAHIWFKPNPHACLCVRRVLQAKQIKACDVIWRQLKDSYLKPAQAPTDKRHLGNQNDNLIIRQNA